MIILDTNVVSELMKRTPEPSVVRWLDGLPVVSVWTTAITIFEVRFGLALLDSGARKSALISSFEAMVGADLDGRVLPFDESAADQTTTISAKGKQNGRSVDLRDSMIAGIVACQNATLATRNVRHFEATGIEVINPWGSNA